MTIMKWVMAARSFEYAERARVLVQGLVVFGLLGAQSAPSFAAQELQELDALYPSLDAL